jgi:hypothetical protein
MLCLSEYTLPAESTTLPPLGGSATPAAGFTASVGSITSAASALPLGSTTSVDFTTSPEGSTVAADAKKRRAKTAADLIMPVQSGLLLATAIT